MKALNQPCDRKTLIEKLKVKRTKLLDARKGLNPLLDLDETKLLLEQWGFSEIEVHQFICYEL
ncbi:MAG: hypothetical protein GY850_13175 [bacterium]|nr:hypothetical protein [bacterium]